MHLGIILFCISSLAFGLFLIPALLFDRMQRSKIVHTPKGLLPHTIATHSLILLIAYLFGVVHMLLFVKQSLPEFYLLPPSQFLTVTRILSVACFFFAYVPWFVWISDVIIEDLRHHAPVVVYAHVGIIIFAFLLILKFVPTFPLIASAIAAMCYICHLLIKPAYNTIEGIHRMAIGLFFALTLASLVFVIWPVYFEQTLFGGRVCMGVTCRANIGTVSTP
jgi:hypothetical protein